MEKTIATREHKVFLRLLRNARKEAKLTQVQLAERLGETQSFVSRCERGERRLDLVEVRTFCRAIGVAFVSFVAEFEKALERRSKRK
jgi:transcriptional regulator with XRE-family HTH domain